MDFRKRLTSASTSAGPSLSPRVTVLVTDAIASGASVSSLATKSVAMNVLHSFCLATQCVGGANYDPDNLRADQVCTQDFWKQFCHC